MRVLTQIVVGLALASPWAAVALERQPAPCAASGLGRVQRASGRGPAPSDDRAARAVNSVKRSSPASRCSRTIDEKRRRARTPAHRARAERLRLATKAPPEGVRLALLAINDQLTRGRLRRDPVPWPRRGSRSGSCSTSRSPSTDADWFSTAVYTPDPRAVRTRPRDEHADDPVLRGQGVRERRRARTRRQTERSIVVDLGRRRRPGKQRLPFLVRATGVALRSERGPRGDVSRRRSTRGPRRIWTERINNVLETGRAPNCATASRGSGTSARDGSSTCCLHGYDERKQLAASSRAGTLEIRVDAQADTAELVLRDGTWRGPAGESDIDERGLRILLTSVGAKSARSTMLGMVREGG